MTNRQQDPEQLERSLRTWLSEPRAPLPDRDVLISGIVSDLTATPQTRRRVLGWWSRRSAGAPRRTRDHALPPRTHAASRQLISSAAASVAALAVLALAVGLVVSTDLPYVPPAGRALVVTPDGGGTYETIADAVAAADDGDTVLVRPGTYVEAVTVDKDITLRGDGPVGSIIIEAPDDGPTSLTGESPAIIEAAYALLLIDSEATVSGLTLRGEDARVHVRGGSPTLAGLVLQGVGTRFKGPWPLAGGVVVVASSPTIRDSAFEGGDGIRACDRSEPIILENRLRDGAGIAGDLGDGAVIRGNDVVGAVEGIGVLRPTTALIEGNTIADAAVGISVGDRINRPVGVGVDPVIRGNTISGSPSGIMYVRGAAPTIEGNTLVDNGTAISALNAGHLTLMDNDLLDNDVGIAIGRADGRVEGNAIRGGATGVSITEGSTATLSANTIEGAASYGVVIFGIGTSPTLTGNDVCGNGTNLFVQDGLDPVLQDNDICPDGLARASP